jgi:hypothetical protein
MDETSPIAFTDDMRLPETGSQSLRRRAEVLVCCHADGHDEEFVTVRNQWNDWRTAMVRVVDLEDIRWAHPAGAPRPLIHATLSCLSLVGSGQFHTCDGGTAHQLTVCILRRNTAFCIFEDLVARAAAPMAVMTRSIIR